MTLCQCAGGSGQTPRSFGPVHVDTPKETITFHYNATGLRMTDSEVTLKYEFLAEGVGIYIFLNGS